MYLYLHIFPNSFHSLVLDLFIFDLKIGSMCFLDKCPVLYIYNELFVTSYRREISFYSPINSRVIVLTFLLFFLL